VYLRGVGYTLVWEDGMVWLDTPVTPFWRPLYATNSLKGICSYQNRVYISHNINPYRWDGFSYYTGTAACSGTAVTGTTTMWSASYVAPGDTIWFYIGTTWTLGGSIIYIASDTSMTLQASGPAAGAVPYHIVRVHEIGLPIPITHLSGSGV